MPEANNRWLIVHADGLGLASPFNDGVREAYKNGFLTSTSLRTNGSAFEDAVERVIPDCPGLGLGIHLNVVEGRSQRTNMGKSSRISDSRGHYKASFGSLFQAYLTRDKATFGEIEDDYRSQIEVVLARGIRPDHLSTHQHSHSVPAIFEIVCKLAAEYEVPFVRLPRERFYLGGAVASHLGVWYPTNLVKHLVMNVLSGKNASIASRHAVRTNDYFVGVLYTGHMSGATVKKGLSPLSSVRSGVVEVLLHPCVVPPDRQERYIAPYLQAYMTHPARAEELSALLDRDVHRFIREKGWELTSYSRLAWSESPSNLAVTEGIGSLGKRSGE